MGQTVGVPLGARAESAQHRGVTVPQPDVPPEPTACQVALTRRNFVAADAAVGSPTRPTRAPPPRTGPQATALPCSSTARAFCRPTRPSPRWLPACTPRPAGCSRRRWRALRCQTATRRAPRTWRRAPMGRGPGVLTTPLPRCCSRCGATGATAAEWWARSSHRHHCCRCSLPLPPPWPQRAPCEALAAPRCTRWPRPHGHSSSPLPPATRPQVWTLERFTCSVALVGTALLPAFLDPREGGQPTSRSVRDYVLNQVGRLPHLCCGGECAFGAFGALCQRMVWQAPN